MPSLPARCHSGGGPLAAWPCPQVPPTARGQRGLSEPIGALSLQGLSRDFFFFPGGVPGVWGCVPGISSPGISCFPRPFPAPRALPSPGAPGEAATPPAGEATLRHQGTLRQGCDKRGPHSIGDPHPSLPTLGGFWFWDAFCPRPPRGPPWGHRARGQRVPPQSGTSGRVPSVPPALGTVPIPPRRGGEGPRRFPWRPADFFFFFPIPVFSCAFPSLGARGEVRGFEDAPRGHPATFGHLWAWRLLPAALGADFGISADFCRCRNAMPGRWPVPRLGWGQLGTTGGCVPHPSRGSRAVWDALPSDFDPFPASPRQINSSGSGCSRPGVTSCPTRPG